MKSFSNSNTDSAGETYNQKSLLLSLSKLSGKDSCRKAMIDMVGSGIDISAISTFMGCSTFTVRHWVKRSAEVKDLNDRPRSGRPSIYSEDEHLRIVAFYCQTPPLTGCCRWTMRWTSLYLKAHPEFMNTSPSKTAIHRVLKNNKLKPHQSRYFLHITEPDFFPKMEHLIELYRNPPCYLFFFDECPGIQILKRITPDLRTEEMKKRLEEFEYVRNGTMDVFAFLNNSDGKICAEVHGDHKGGTFIEVFRRHVQKFPKGEQLNYVMDNLSSHCGYQFCLAVAELSEIECPPEKNWIN